MAKKHTHMYHKIQQKYGAGIWACALPNCTHYLPLNVSDMIFGRESLCTNCMTVMILDENTLKDNEPVCRSCDLAGQGILIEDDLDVDTPLAKLKKRALENEVIEPNEIESEEIHAPECEIHIGGDCTCM